jgi:hypothetical protein
MDGTIETVAKEIVNPGTPVFTRWQADAVDDQETDVPAIGPITAIGRRQLATRHQKMVFYFHATILPQETDVYNQPRNR